MTTKSQRYLLQPSANTAGGIVLTDTDLGIVCRFRSGKFNKTQEFTVLEDIAKPNPLALARAVREMADWLLENHPELI